MTIELSFAPVQAVERSITPPPEQAFQYHAALFFLDGHYLFQWRESSRLTSKFVTSADVAAAFSQVERDSGWLPEGVRRAGSSPRGDWFLYTQPAQAIAVQLDASEPYVTINIPRTCLLGVGANYWMWAQASLDFEPAGKLYRAPFPNVGDEGSICWGQNKPPAASPDIAPAAWKLFFNTPFNGDLAGGKSKKHKNDVRDALRRTARKIAYPTSDLVEMSDSLDKAIERIIARRA